MSEGGPGGTSSRQVRWLHEANAEAARLMDHLQEKGFERDTQMRAGLISWTDDGQVVDRYRDRLVMVAVPTETVAGERAIRNGIDLTHLFDGVRLLKRPTGPLLTNPGQLKVLADFVVTETETVIRTVSAVLAISTTRRVSKTPDRASTDDGAPGRFLD